MLTETQIATLHEGIARFAACDWRARDSWLDAARAAARQADCQLASGMIAVQAAALGMTSDDCGALAAAHTRYVAGLGHPSQYPPAPRLKRDRLRIGYMGACFDDPRAASLTAATITAHDHSRHEIIAYGLTPGPGGAPREGIESAADHFRDIAHLAAHEIAGLMRCDDLDILIDLAAYTPDAHAAIHLYGPARVTLRMARGQPPAPLVPRWRTQARTDAPRDPALRPLPEDAVVLACFNRQFKIEPEVFGAWMRILAAAPQAYLWLTGDARSDGQLRAAAASAGISPQRLLFAKPLPLDAHLARCAQADLHLDTWHCGGHLSLLQALSAGVPVLALAGAGKAMLDDAGLADLVAASATDYLARAIGLCASRDNRDALRSRVSDAFAAPACERRFGQYVRNLEDRCSRAWAGASSA